MKKTPIKTAKISAPAKKVPVKTVKKTAATPVKKKASAPAVKTSAAKPIMTIITAKIDIGFGNHLYLRGEGPGLSWDMGLPLDCVTDDQWRIALPETSKPILYKFLINDLTWSAGPDYITEPGKKVTLTPSF